jgi:hypothetical protein
LGNEKALYDFAQRFPEEPAAMRIWRDAEIRHRAEFIARLDEARTAVAARAARIAAETTDLEARIEATIPAFEAWLADEKRGSANSSKLDPLAIVKHYVSAAERKLREDVAALSSALAQAKGVEEDLEAAKSAERKLREDVSALSSALAQAKGVEEELEAAKSEIIRLNEELTGRNEELDRFQKESANLSDAASRLAKDLETAKTEIARLTEKMEVGGHEKDRLQYNLTAADGLVAHLKRQLDEANLLVVRLSKLKGADKIIGAAAAQAHSGAEEPKAGSPSRENASGSSAEGLKKSPPFPSGEGPTKSPSYWDEKNPYTDWYFQQSPSTEPPSNQETYEEFVAVTNVWANRALLIFFAFFAFVAVVMFLMSGASPK